MTIGAMINDSKSSGSGRQPTERNWTPLNKLRCVVPAGRNNKHKRWCVLIFYFFVEELVDTTRTTIDGFSPRK